MTNDIAHPFSDKAVCVALAKSGIISKEQAVDIFEKKDKARENIEKQKNRRNGLMPTGVRIVNPTTIVDVITSFKLHRADKKEVELDEDTIFKALAGEWDKPYKKIDPLKLDLNLVTTTIPRSFAMKHLVLPIEVENGSLVIATSNPFNTEVFDDIGRVRLMPVKTVVTSKSDIIRLIDEFFGFKRSIAAAESQFDSASTVDLGNLEQYIRLKSPDELPANDHHIVNAVNHLFSYAFDQRASDIHIEPKREIHDPLFHPAPTVHSGCQYDHHRRPH